MALANLCSAFLTSSVIKLILIVEQTHVYSLQVFLAAKAKMQLYKSSCLFVFLLAIAPKFFPYASQVLSECLLNA